MPLQTYCPKVLWTTNAQSGMVKGIMKPTKHPFVTRTLTCVLIAAGLFQLSLSSHAESITPEEAHSIGVEAYLYFIRS